jgi:hypothetical protein
VSNFIPQVSDAEVLSHELNELIGQREQNGETFPSPFEETYAAIADVIIAASRMYIGLRRVENVILGDQEEQA